MARFTDKVVLVTGGASGIGLATATAFAREGARLLIADLDPVGADAAARSIERDGGKARGIAVDVADPAACEAMVGEALAAYGRLDIAFNNAGIPSPPAAHFEEILPADWDRVIATNLNGMFYCMRAEAAAMRRQGGGVIVNTASSASTMAAAGMPAYVASKHGVAGLTKSAALDLIGHGIRVNAICPGMTATPMMLPLLEDEARREHLHGMIPAGHLCTPDDIANGVLFLASDAASYAVGTMLALDGGLTLG